MLFLQHCAAHSAIAHIRHVKKFDTFLVTTPIKQSLKAVRQCNIANQLYVIQSSEADRNFTRLPSTYQKGASCKT
jgi:hypothetical protein